MPPAPEQAPRNRGRKQLLLKLGAFLLLGVVVNVAVAWGCAMWSIVPPMSDLKSESFDSVPGEFKELVRPDWLDAPPGYPGGGPSIMLLVRPRVACGWTCKRLEIWWMIPGLDSMAPNFSVYLMMAGWPMRSVSCHGYAHPAEILRAATKRGDWSFAIEPAVQFRAERMGTRGDEQFARPLPFRPIWPGFAINTTFYAALLWVLWIAPGKIRRFVRIRGHRCPACGYKIAPGGGIGPRCSECGFLIRG